MGERLLAAVFSLTPFSSSSAVTQSEVIQPLATLKQSIGICGLPYISTWTLTVQRAITNDLSLEVAYVGNHGTKLLGFRTSISRPSALPIQVADQHLQQYNDGSGRNRS